MHLMTQNTLIKTRRRRLLKQLTILFPESLDEFLRSNTTDFLFLRDDTGKQVGQTC